ncbi:MAG TPA: NrfD/PsrC family molybdoenzyme membrane anchor subunit, partial [Solirubrobacteraceae bacterium]
MSGSAGGAPSRSAGDPAPRSATGASGAASYHGQQILKSPVWSWEIPTYFFVGGVAGASATLAYAAELRGSEQLGRRAWLTASGAIMVCPGLLISDLGRPARFVNMLRMFKVTSPMSVGSWILSVSGATTALAGVHALTGRLAPGAAVARPIAAVSGLALSTYTAALLADTAVPAWHEARQTLPFVFGAGAAASAAGAVTALTPVRSAAPARRLAIGAAGAELLATQLMESRLGMHAETFHRGRARTLRWTSRACLSAGATLLARAGARSRPAA